MFRLFEFLRSIYLLLLFIVLEGVAILYYTYSDSYTEAKIIALSTGVVGGVNSAVSSVGSYFSLSKTNKQLVDRIAYLEGEVAQYRTQISDSLLMAMSHQDMEVRYMGARVVSNSINRLKNYIVVNRGLVDGVRADMAVLTPQNQMVGYIVDCSDHFAVVLSVLNVDFRSSGKLLGDNHAGSIGWSGNNRYHITLSELSKYTDIYEGAEVVTTGFSQLFPDGVSIGRVSSFALNDAQTAYNVEVELSAEISALSEVLIVNNIASVEGREILNSIDLNNLK